MRLTQLLIATLALLVLPSAQEESSPTVPWPEQAALFAESLERLGVTYSKVTFAREPKMPREGYRIDLEDGFLRIKASSSVGAAWAVSHLLRTVRVEGGHASWPDQSIQTAPAHGFRCFMVDMGRNPHPPEVLRQVVDMLWFHRVNYLQLHLTDDQLSSWPSAVFPKLVDDRAGWTLRDYVELERYSQVRGVTIIPEIDVPGHSTLLRRHYPEVFGTSATELATLPSAQEGVEALISETLEIFQATPVVHMGGDEAYGVPVETQRDFINRIHAFVKSKGKRTIVWEGPGLGEGANKVNPEVVHMNWRTIAFPAQDMLDAGYPVVNASWDPFYIVDHFPRTMFTAVDLERCYNWDPQRFAHINHEIPTFQTPHLTDTREGILGFCMPWWEGRPENLFALCEPRLAAVAETAWVGQDQRDFSAFQQSRAANQDRLCQLSGIQIAPMPMARPPEPLGNLAFGAHVSASKGSCQPHFSPARLTNGITARFDHFLGFPTQPTPLDITVDLKAPTDLARIVVYEDATQDSFEEYELLVSLDGETFEPVGQTEKGSRGRNTHVEHSFKSRQVRYILIRTRGCQDLTFPSFSRLSEVQAFAH
ncbi:MAG: family 20 glycosylhydrolase [Planctomycetota bacterium]|nr:family 20 glycosylhydrolase [Planctomycetota bacterium]